MALPTSVFVNVQDGQKGYITIEEVSLHTVCTCIYTL